MHRCGHDLISITMKQQYGSFIHRAIKHNISDISIASIKDEKLCTPNGIFSPIKNTLPLILYYRRFKTIDTTFELNLIITYSLTSTIASFQIKKVRM
jgi:hypothetical protein